MQAFDFSTIDAEISYNPSAYIAINDSRCEEYLLQLYFRYKGAWVLSHTDPKFPAYTWFRSFVTTRNKWKFEVYGFVGDKLLPLLQNTYNETGKRVVFTLHSESAKIDTAYISKAVEFQKQNCCIVFVKTKFHQLLKNLGNPFVRVVDTSTSVDNIYAAFDIRKNEIQSNLQYDWFTAKHWPERGKALETFDHQQNWMFYSQEDVFDDIIHYE
tara:strand:+ start:383 stop:1021 length:639 start_codon:yes stop_codon:yes gene_type:complete